MQVISASLILILLVLHVQATFPAYRRRKHGEYRDFKTLRFLHSFLQDFTALSPCSVTPGERMLSWDWRRTVCQWLMKTWRCPGKHSLLSALKVCTEIMGQHWLYSNYSFLRTQEAHAPCFSAQSPSSPFHRRKIIRANQLHSDANYWTVWYSHSSHSIWPIWCLSAGEGEEAQCCFCPTQTNPLIKRNCNQVLSAAQASLKISNQRKIGSWNCAIKSTSRSDILR